MPNLVGIWNPELSETEILAALRTQLRRVGTAGRPYREYVRAHHGFGVGLLDHGILENGDQPAESDDGRFSLMLDGEVYNAAELTRRFRDELPPTPMPPPQLLLRLLIRHGDDIVALFNGLFALVLYDRDAQRLTLVSDRLGFRPLFYVDRGHTVLFATELKALSAVDPTPRKIDDIGTLERFCYGSHVIDRTWLDGYLRVPPATILTIDGRRRRRRTYWRYAYDEQARDLGQAAYVTRFAVLLDRAVERCMKGSHRIGILLSGGYDSRSVAASIRPHHLPLPAVTFGSPQSRDVRFAAMLAERLGLDHHIILNHSPYLYPNCHAIVWRTEGLVSFADATSIDYHESLKEHMDVILLGLLGEFGGSHTWPKLLLARSRQTAIDVLFERVVGSRVTAARRIFNPAFFRTTFPLLRARFQDSIDAVNNNHPHNIADCWRFINAQPLSTFQAPSIDRHRFEARAPHLDSDLIDFLLTIPPFARLEQRVYKRVIAYAFPAIRRVPCTNSGLPVNPHFAYEYAAMATRYVARRVTTPLQEALGNGRSPDHESRSREHRDLAGEFRAEPELRDKVLRPLLDAEIFPERIFDRAGLDSVITEHYDGQQDHKHLLAALISWGLAVRYFLYDDFADVPADMYPR